MTNALQITSQYPEDQFNLLVPMKTVAEISDIQKPVMNVVSISTNINDGEIYLQDSKNKGYAITKKGLNKLMRAAGIRILYTKPVVPSTCQKCAQVNRGIGKPVSCGRCGNKDVKFEARLSVPQLTGENTEVVAHKEIIAEDATAGMSERQKQEFLKFRSEMCESKAINRALRTAMQIKATYTQEELQKPFVVAYLAPNLDNPEVKAEAVKNFFASSQELYGGSPETRKVEYVEDDPEEDMGCEVPRQPIDRAQDTAYYDDGDGYQQELQEPEQPVQQPARRVQQQRPARQTQEQQNEDQDVCTDCGRPCTGGVVRFSRQKYGRVLCMTCQKNYEG